MTTRSSYAKFKQDQIDEYCQCDEVCKKCGKKKLKQNYDPKEPIYKRKNSLNNLFKDD